MEPEICQAGHGSPHASLQLHHGIIRTRQGGHFHEVVAGVLRTGTVLPCPTNAGLGGPY